MFASAQRSDMRRRTIADIHSQQHCRMLVIAKAKGWSIA
jgi:hypothetical protein